MTNRLSNNVSGALDQIRRHPTMFAILCVAFLSFAGQALAFVAPAAGSFAFDVYDLLINDIADGAIGFVIGAGLMVAALFLGISGRWTYASIAAVAGGLIANIDTLTTSLGYTI